MEGMRETESGVVNVKLLFLWHGVKLSFVPLRPVQSFGWIKVQYSLLFYAIFWSPHFDSNFSRFSLSNFQVLNVKA